MYLNLTATQSHRESPFGLNNKWNTSRHGEPVTAASTKSENKMKSRLLLNVIIRESSAIFELLSGKDKTLLLWRNSFLILDLRLDVRDRVVRLDIQGDRLSREGLDEDLHGTTTETEDKMEGGFLLNVVIREGTTIFELFSSEDQTLLLRWDSFLVLDLSLDGEGMELYGSTMQVEMFGAG